MTTRSVAEALAAVLAAVPGVLTVQREEALQLGRRGSVVPEPAVCPVVRIGRSRRLPARERGWLLDGTRERQTPYQCDVWAYLSAADSGADGFLDLVDSLQAAVRARPTLDGQADTPQSRLIQLRPVEDVGTPRALQANADRPLFHASFVVLAREAVKP